MKSNISNRNDLLSDIPGNVPTMPRRWLRLTDLSKPKLTKEASTSMEDLSFNVSNAPGVVIRPKSMCVPENFGTDEGDCFRRSGFKDYHRYESISTDGNVFGSESKPDLPLRSANVARNEGNVRRQQRARRNPVQRAASRLYRAGNEPVKGGRECVGPEFVVRAALPNKQLIIPDIKGTVRKIVTVIMLNGQKLDVVCNPNSTTAGQLFEVIQQLLNVFYSVTLTFEKNRYIWDF